MGIQVSITHSFRGRQWDKVCGNVFQGAKARGLEGWGRDQPHWAGGRAFERKESGRGERRGSGGRKPERGRWEGREMKVGEEGGGEGRGRVKGNGKGMEGRKEKERGDENKKK